MSCNDPYQILSLLSLDKKSVDLFMDNIEDVATKKNHDFHGLSISEKEQTSALLVMALDDPAEWFINIDDLDALVRFLAQYKLTNNKEHLTKALEIFDKNLVNHFSDNLDSFISKIWQEHQQDLQENQQALLILGQRRAS